MILVLSVLYVFLGFCCGLAVLPFDMIGCSDLD
jgi:hypothetical protein